MTHEVLIEWERLPNMEFTLNPDFMRNSDIRDRGNEILNAAVQLHNNFLDSIESDEDVVEKVGVTISVRGMDDVPFKRSNVSKSSQFDRTNARYGVDTLVNAQCGYSLTRYKGLDPTGRIVPIFPQHEKRTALLSVKVRPELRRLVIDSAFRAGQSPNDWLRTVIENAVSRDEWPPIL